MVTIEKLTKTNMPDLLKIKLANDQIKFAGTVKDFIKDKRETIHLHVINSDNKIIGFFKIDTDYSFTYEFCPLKGIGLRAFAIDINQQGKGLGTSSVKALLPYLNENYSSYNSIFLTVNCKNPRAFTCYLKGGFIDTGKTYLGGMAGPQNIMFADLV